MKTGQSSFLFETSFEERTVPIDLRLLTKISRQKALNVFCCCVSLLYPAVFFFPLSNFSRYWNCYTFTIEKDVSHQILK